MATSVGVTPPEPFQFHKPADWPRWIRRFDRFRIASKLHEQENDPQVNMLIYCMGDEADDILKSFTFAEGERMTYEIVKEKFDAYFIPKRNIIYERAMFNSRRQEDGETVDSFITALYTLSEHCQYGNLRNEMIRDRIVVGIRNTQLAEKLQMDTELTLEKATAQARQAETVKLQQPILRGVTNSSIAAVRAKDKTQVPESQISCSRCGKTHAPGRHQCPAREATCHKCRKKGHFKSMCRSTAKVAGVEEERKEALLGAVTDINRSKWTVTLQVNETPLQFHIDTGAEVTVISEKDWKKIGKPPLLPADRKLRCPDKHTMHVKGMLKVHLKSYSKEAEGEVYVVKELAKPLLGQPAIEQLHLLSRIGGVSGQLNPVTQFPALFEGLGKLEGPYTIQLKEGAKPFALSTPRRIAVPLLPAVKRELQRMEKLGVIRKIDDPTEWCAGMVVVPKANGKVRICVDLTKLNQSVKRERHPLPAVDQVLAQLAGAQVLSKLDANSGFWQIPLSPQSSRLTTFITPYGRYCFHRLPFGISSAPEHFQRRMSEILSGISGVVCMMDDILVHGRTQEEHDTHLQAVLQRLQGAGMTLNVEKCQFSQTSLSFLGHIIDNSGIRPDPNKVKAIVAVKKPTNISDVRRYLGMVNQLSKFAPNLAEMTQPLRDLLVKGREWMWGEAQEKAFSATKQALVKSPVLAIYDPNLKTTVSADASSFGLGAVLLQEQLSGELKPVAYISRSLSTTEQRYAQIEKEALAFTWACERLADYLIGLDFHICTDHKPLVPLFSSKHLEEMPIRVQRFRLRMMRFRFTISHVPGKELIIADTLSRSPAFEPAESERLLHEEGDAYIKVVMQSLPATERRIEEIRKSQQQDEACQLIMTYCHSTWPSKQCVPRSVKPYLPLAAELSVENGLLTRENRIVIPPQLREDILNQIHVGHQGISKCRDRARQSVWCSNCEMTHNCSVRCTIIAWHMALELSRTVLSLYMIVVAGCMLLSLIIIFML